jgi:hypothetical protein
VTLVAGRSRSSTLTYRRVADRHRLMQGGLPVQGIDKQTPFFPNYEVQRGRGAELVDRYCNKKGRQQLEALFETRPWDEMWRRRTRHLYLVDPATLSADQLSWIACRLEFQYDYRQALWLMTHWIYLSRLFVKHPETHPYWDNLYTRRNVLVDRLRDASLALNTSFPAGTFTPLLMTEPALWVEPARQCGWSPDPLTAGNSFIEQVARLDDEEPIRAFWAYAPGRFPEALLAGQVQVFESHGGACWALPPPWGRPEYTPRPFHLATDGSPGPDFASREAPL